MLVGSFIEVARLESCQKSGELWLEGEGNKAFIIHFGKIQTPIRLEIFQISTRSQRHSIMYPLLGI